MKPSTSTRATPDHVWTRVGNFTSFSSTRRRIFKFAQGDIAWSALVLRLAWQLPVRVPNCLEINRLSFNVCADGAARSLIVSAGPAPRSTYLQPNGWKWLVGRLAIWTMVRRKW